MLKRAFIGISVLILGFVILVLVSSQYDILLFPDKGKVEVSDGNK